LSQPIAELHRILSSRFRTPRPDELRHDLDLGSAGFGLDSISLVELLIVWEELCGCRIPYTIFDEGPVTVGALLAWSERAAEGTAGE
jgi:acyl carrier protein